MKEISHKGRIVEITPEVTTVEIVSQSACSECHAKSLCGLSENVTKVVQLPTDGFGTYNVGDEVEVCIKKSMGYKAVWLCYVLPLALLLAGILIFTSAGTGEIVAGLGSIAIVGLYYLVLWIFKDALAKECVFYMK